MSRTLSPSSNEMFVHLTRDDENVWAGILRIQPQLNESDRKRFMDALSSALLEQLKVSLCAVSGSDRISLHLRFEVKPTDIRSRFSLKN